MISLSSEFRLLDRGFQDTIVLIPGWATDHRIFAGLELNYNYILPGRFNPFDFNVVLSEFLHKTVINKISLFGWSLGGFLAAEFALKNPDMVDEVILMSIRKRYDIKILQEIEGKIKRNKKGYLFKFYNDCFSDNDKEGLSWFKKKLLKVYLNTIGIEDLLLGLSYLSKTSLNAETLAPIEKLRIFHGQDDKIAPFKEAIEIKSCLSKAVFIAILDAGHIPFLNKNFKEKFNNG